MTLTRTEELERIEELLAELHELPRCVAVRLEAAEHLRASDWSHIRRRIAQVTRAVHDCYLAAVEREAAADGAS